MNTTALPIAQRPAIAEWFPVFIGLIALYVPTYIDLARTIWASEEQAHGPIILGVALWFFWKLRNHHSQRGPCPGKSRLAGFHLRPAALRPWPLARHPALRSRLANLSLIASLLLILRGWAALRAAVVRRSSSCSS